MRRFSFPPRVLVIVVLVAASTRCGRPDDAAPTASPPPDTLLTSPVDPAVLASLPDGLSPETLAEGRRLFATCSVCHGFDARGTQLGPSLRDDTWIHVSGRLDEIQEITRRGIPVPREFPVPMPPSGGGRFDDRELRAIALYIDALGRSGR